MSIPIRDNRRPGWGWFNYEVLDEYGALIGAHGIAVYMVLVRHANNETQATWPAIATIAGKTGLSESTVRRTLVKLQDGGLITIEAQHDSEGRQRPNCYTLVQVNSRGVTQTPSRVSHRQGEGVTQTPEQDPVNKTQKEQESAPAPATGDISPQPPNSNGHTSKAAMVLAEEKRQPEVTLPVPPPRRPGQALQPGEPGTPPVQKRSRPAPLPEGWIPDAKYAKRAVDEYPELTDAQRADALQQFRHHYEANGLPYANWGAKYLEWLHHEVHTYARAPGKGGPASASDPPPPPTYHKPDPYGGRR